MKNDNSFKQTLKRPRGFFLVLVYVLTVCFSSLAIILAIFSGNTLVQILSYVVYGISAVLLGYSVYTIVIYAPSFKQKTVYMLKKSRFLTSLMENYGFKTIIFSICSFAITIAFALVNLIGAILYRSIWYASISAYYFVLIFFRGGILLSAKKLKDKYSDNPLKQEIGKWKIYLFGGIVLSIMEIAMAVAVTQLMLSKKPLQKNEIMAITNATYTFYKTGMAIYNLIKARKFNNPVTQSLRNINFADACMSMVSLTVLLLSTFGEDDMLFLKALVGFTACIVTLITACLMIIHASKQIKNLKDNSNERR